MKVLWWVVFLLLGLSASLLFISYATPYFHPETLPILPFIGLFYPVWLLLTTILTPIAIWKKKAVGYVGLFILIVGIKSHLKVIGLHFFTPKPAENAIKIMSYNVRLFGLYDENALERRNNIFEFLRKENPDIACFQEFYHQDQPTSFETLDSIRSILKSVDDHQRSAYNKIGHRNFGIAIFSKYPMIARGDVMFENQGLMDFNYCIFADIVKNQDTFRVYNVHLQSIRLSEPGKKEHPSLMDRLELGYSKMKQAYSKRSKQAERVINHMKTSPYPIVLCGDFNDTPMSYTYHQFNKRLNDAFLVSGLGFGSTFIGSIPAGRIDYIFHSEGIESSGFNAHNVEYSDHKPISCNISIRKN
ncbi:MAG: hypothetical protein RL110_1254 [Bacteroidota bacterium]|jgi:endonuclease/exonuclease/phosphatase family metal-dependent hydrolase|nr:hypothetical protein [Flavobacteriia bacterium]